ncbi:hypothetical protein PLESTB_001392100 [Pleodorina starrii]|uniref:Uncharacterized protein n=1 Tax=Pleodorina starrii TaxID=330485 RepID=A0A9W6F6X3_9CHLO|nr:hypothetical protein PLESTM_000540400 [Pleodorina starrii]GLC58707.1 hypothetical protein PLESTB_001392100 [Pleodorina starrii]GLC75208.1 hypothetical protein PLESTF_001607000 [Pleodorina starrii]
MLRTLGFATRRREVLRQSCPVLHLVNLLPEGSTDNQALPAASDLASASPPSPRSGCPHKATASRWLSTPCSQRLAASDEQAPSPSSSAVTPTCAANAASTPTPFFAPSFARAACYRRPLSRLCMEAAPLTTAAALQRYLNTHPSHHHHQQQTRSASSSAAAKAKGRGGTGGAKTAATSAPPRVRTPDWARMPLLLDAVPAVMRRRASRLATLHKQLQTEVTKAEAGGWAAAGKLAQAEAAVRALPVPPKDKGESDLAAATAPGTSFESAHATLKELCRRGVCLGSEQHLAPLLRKASSAGQLSAALELLRTNHLMQAAARLGAHDAAHSGLHGVVVEECQRLRAAAPLVELWDSLYEYGMEPSREAAQAAVQAAVALRDGPAAAALLALSCQYSQEPLAAEAVPSVLGLLEADNADEAAKLRQLLPRLGFPDTA